MQKETGCPTHAAEAQQRPAVLENNVKILGTPRNTSEVGMGRELRCAWAGRGASQASVAVSPVIPHSHRLKRSQTAAFP